MIRRLRRRFIRIATLSVTAVMLLLTVLRRTDCPWLVRKPVPGSSVRSLKASWVGW